MARVPGVSIELLDSVLPAAKVVEKCAGSKGFENALDQAKNVEASTKTGKTVIERPNEAKGVPQGEAKQNEKSAVEDASASESKADENPQATAPGASTEKSKNGQGKVTEEGSVPETTNSDDDEMNGQETTVAASAGAAEMLAHILFLSNTETTQGKNATEETGGKVTQISVSPVEGQGGVPASAPLGGISATFQAVNTDAKEVPESPSPNPEGEETLPKNVMLEGEDIKDVGSLKRDLSGGEQNIKPSSNMTGEMKEEAVQMVSPVKTEDGVKQSSAQVSLNEALKAELVPKKEGVSTAVPVSSVRTEDSVEKAKAALADGDEVKGATNTSDSPEETVQPNTSTIQKVSEPPGHTDEQTRIGGNVDPEGDVGGFSPTGKSIEEEAKAKTDVATGKSSHVREAAASPAKVEKSIPGVPSRLETVLKTEVHRQILEAATARLQIAVRDHVTHARIHLDPPELGKVDMELRVEAGVMNAKLRVEHTWVKETVMSNLRTLRDALHEHGVKMDQFTVDVGSRFGASDFGRQFAGDNPAGEPFTEAFSAEGIVADAATAQKVDVMAASGRGGTSSLSIFA